MYYTYIEQEILLHWQETQLPLLYTFLLPRWVYGYFLPTHGHAMQSLYKETDLIELQNSEKENNKQKHPNQLTRVYRFFKAHTP